MSPYQSFVVLSNFCHLLTPCYLLTFYFINTPFKCTCCTHHKHNSCSRLIVRTLPAPIHFSNSPGAFGHRSILTWGDRGLAGWGISRRITCSLQGIGGRARGRLLGRGTATMHPVATLMSPISSCILSQHGATRTLNACWGSTGFTLLLVNLKICPRSPMRVGAAKIVSHGKLRRPCIFLVTR